MVHFNTLLLSRLDIIATVVKNCQHMPYPTLTRMVSVKRFCNTSKSLYPTVRIFLLVKFNAMPSWTLIGLETILMSSQPRGV